MKQNLLSPYFILITSRLHQIVISLLGFAMLIGCEKENSENSTNLGWNGEISTTFADGQSYDQNITIYEISTPSELAYLATIVNSGIDMSGCTIKLTENLDLNYSNWTPIGQNNECQFCGIFDGSNHSIASLNVNNNDNYNGLFGYISECSILNLTIKNPKIQGAAYIGALCGYITSNSLVFACRVIGGTVSSTGNCVGGLIGRCSYNSSILASYNTSNVSGEKYIGGVVGYSHNQSHVTSCYNKGVISGDYEVGGIVGSSFNTSYITTCYNTAYVSGIGKSLCGIGGIVGYAEGSSTIKACYNTGYIYGDNYAYVNGIVGSSTSSNYTTFAADSFYLSIEGVEYNSYGVESPDLITTMKSEEIISALNIAANDSFWEYDTYLKNDGYPILSSIQYEQ